MASLYLIRHGQASFGSANYDQLSPLGQRQADVSGQFFADVGLHFAEAASGDLSRQREAGERVIATIQPAPPALRVRSPPQRGRQRGSNRRFVAGTVRP